MLPVTANGELKSKGNKKSNVIHATTNNITSLGTLMKARQILADKPKRIKIKIKRKKMKPPAEPAKK